MESGITEQQKAFIKGLEEINSGNWNKVVKELKSDITLQHLLLTKSLDQFTLFASSNLDSLDDSIIDKVFNLYGDCSQSNWIYYHTLRILNLLLVSADNIKRFNSSYYDEQFFKAAYKVNPEIIKFISKRHAKIYLGKGLPSKVARSVITSINLFKAMLKRE